MSPNEFVCEGFGNMLNSLETKSVAKSIIRNMEMNGSLETRLARLREKEAVQQEEEEEEEDDEEEEEEDDEEEEEMMEVKKGNKIKHN